jgi:hypothetical protein
VVLGLGSGAGVGEFTGAGALSLGLADSTDEAAGLGDATSLVDLTFVFGVVDSMEFVAVADLEDSFGFGPGDLLFGAFLSFVFGVSVVEVVGVCELRDFRDLGFGFGSSTGAGEGDGEEVGLVDLVLRLGEVMIGMGRSTSSRTLARPIS